MEPPPCIQNAMMTKDKKPFTYTPGGLNLNEIKSPRMARRIERNAAYEGVGSSPAQQNRPQVPTGSLPPSAMAAMQPQMHVQVFPSGPPPPPPMNMSRGGVPPPPPPMSNIPPPPPPPTQPLPTQKVRTADQQVVERPDMTKIIPENPMCLLKKTGGPKVRNTVLEEMYRNPERSGPQQLPMSRINQQASQSPQPQQVRSPPIENVPYQPNFVQKNGPEARQQAWSPPIIEKKEPIRETTQNPERNVNVGCIYIPPMNQNKTVTSPTSSLPSPKVQTPGTPTLKEAPKPWQQKQQVKQDEAPQWVRREPSFSSSPVPQEQVTPQSASNTQQQRPTWPQGSTIPQNVQPPRYADPRSQQPAQQKQVYSNVQESRYQDPRIQHPQQRQPVPGEEGGVYTQRVMQPQFDPSSHPNAVFITQPLVLQHPGANYGPPVINRREIVTPKQDGGAITIPIQIEGRETPNQNRNMSRQQSWSNNPTQSGSFRVIQKMTGTDGEEEDLNGAIEQMPRYPQQFPAEQMRKMQLNDTDQELLNRFKQVPNDDGHSNPQIRNIPIQIEGNGGPKTTTYVPPSQQVPAEEPKKYTGSSIPSRSFRMLQAMTAPDSCANVKEANETNEHYDFPYQGNNWAFPPAYPMYNPQPYWPPYYSPTPYKLPSTEHSNSDPELNRASANKTPQPYFGYPAYTPTRELDPKSVPRPPSSFSRCSSSTELENINWRQTPVPYPMYPNPTTPIPGRRTPKTNNTDSESDSKTCTPVPFWYGHPPPQDGQDKPENAQCNYNYYPPYPPPFYDPYYYPYYYYGYPPMFSPLPYMRHGSDPDDLNGYSSMDEMTYYNQKNKQNTNQVASNVSPEIVVTPTPETHSESQKELSSSESDTETETNDVVQEPTPNSEKLQTIRSVPDIHVYEQSDVESEISEEEETDVSSNSSIYEEEREEETVPHQLSVIFEVSEVTDTPRQARESSVFSDCTTVEGIRSDDEDADDSMSKQWISDHLEEIASRIQSRINSRIELDDPEVFASFTVKTPSPRREIVPTKDEEEILNHTDDFTTEKDEHETFVSTEDEEKTQNEENHSEYQNNNIEESNSKEDNCSKNEDDINNSSQTGETNKTNNITEEVQSKESSDSEDWWGVIGKNEDDVPRRKSNTYYEESDVVQKDGEVETIAQDEATSEPNEASTDMQMKIEKSNDEENHPSEVNTHEEHDDDKSYLEENKKDTDIDAINENIEQVEVKICDNVFYEENTDEGASYQDEKEEISNCEINEFGVDYKETTVPKLEITSAHSSNSSASSRKVSSESDDSSDSEESDSSEDEKNKNDVNNNEHNDEEETVVIPSIKDRIKALQECISVKKKSMKVEEEIRISVKNQVESIDNGELNKSKPVSAKSSVKSFDEISEEDSGVTDLSRQYSDNEEFPELRKMSKYQRASTHSRLFQLLQEECENEDEEDNLEMRKTQLTLPLNSNVTDKLAEELVHSMLKQKKGQIFRNMSVDKLHAAAKKVLQEDGDSFDTPSDGFSDYLSPLRNDTGNSTPQEFYGHYNEYMQYYDSWAQAAAVQENEIIQSKTFRMIQDSSQKPGGFSTTLAKCPRVLSGKNVYSDLKKLVETPEESSSTNNPDPKS